jgi:ribulose-phosphate 3-epimerase
MACIATDQSRCYGTTHMSLELDLGIKSDPVEYRYSLPWLFRLMSQEGIRLLQLGTWFEYYQLPDAYFRDLRKQAEDHGVQIASIFTAHRELGGFFREEPGYEQVARRNFQRSIEIGGILGAKSVGSNPGAVLRDRMGAKPHGTATYIRHMKELMHFAREQGVQWLTIEPMSCLAEPPTLPDEIIAMGQQLQAYHLANPQTTAPVGYCADVAHGYADHDRQVRHDNIGLLEPCFPWLYELHLKNTDAFFDSTFGFTPADIKRGVVDIPAIRQLLLKRHAELPVKKMVGYLEMGGPKLGRDYTDFKLEDQLRSSLQYLKQAFLDQAPSVVRPTLSATVISEPAEKAVKIAPSLMCADMCHLESDIRRLEAVGCDILHIDIMDAKFTPNMPLGLVTIEQVRPITSLPFDVHLMVEDNDFFVDQVARFGVQMISVHVESCRHLDRTLSRIRDRGIKAGAALNPATPLSAIEYVLDRLDFVLIMTVNPGFAGQKLVPSAMQKIADCRAFLDQRGRNIPIQIDGNVSFANIPKMVASGGDILVAGTSSVFSKEGTLAANTARTRAAIKAGLAERLTGVSQFTALTV